MADMRQILTYPNNVGTDYIDPDYIGNATSGLTRRIDELLAGTYKAWLNPLTITATTSEVMQNISKFGSYYENQSYAGHLSRYDFWNKPLVVATKKLIDSETILLGNVQVNPMVITTTTPHEFEDGIEILTSGVNGTFGAAVNSNTYENLYAKVISSTELQLATDEALTDLVGFVGGVTNYTLPADNGLMMLYAQPSPPYSWTPSHINLSSMLSGGGILSIPDGQPITINSSVPANSGLTNVTWYLKNTATSATDHVYELWFNPSLTNIISPQVLNYPLGNTVTATINETNPGTITTSRPLLSHELFVDVQNVNNVSWSDNRTEFGNPSATPSSWYYKLIPTVDTNTYKVTTGINSNTDTLDFGINTPTEYVSVAFYPMVFSTSTLPWAQVSNGRIKLDKPHNAITDGHETTISGGNIFPNQYPNNPYYLKGVPSLDTPTYSVFDVYKDSNLTNLYGPSDYAPASHLIVNQGAEGSGQYGALTTSYIELRFRGVQTTEVMISQTASAAYNMNIGDTITTTHNGAEYIVTSHSAINREFNNRNTAPSLNDTALYDTGALPAFWIPDTFTANADMVSGTEIRWSGDSKTNSGDFVVTDAGFPQVNGHKLYTGPITMWKNQSQGYPLPSNLDIAFEPVPYHTPTYGTIADIKVSNSSLDDWQQQAINFPTSFPAMNSGNEYKIQTGLWNQFPPMPQPYTAYSSAAYLKPVPGHPQYFNLYSDFARTIPLLNTPGPNPSGDFNPQQKTPSGPTNYVDVANGGTYPTAIDLTNTNVVWQIESITWYDGQEGELNMFSTGNLSQTVYIKNISSTEVEFYFDSALTNAYTSADFISDWTAIGPPTSQTHGLQFLTKEPVDQYSQLHPSPGNYSFGYMTKMMENTMSNVQRLTNSTDVFNFLTYAPDSNGTITGAPSVISTLNTGVDPLSFGTNIDIVLPLVDTTTGQIGPHLDESNNPYEIDTVELILPGNETFTYQTGASTTAPGGKVNTSKYWNAGSTTPSYYTNGATPAIFDTTVDTNGYLQNVTLVEEPDAEGRYPTGEDIALFIEALPDTYTAPVLTPAEQADIYDTHDEWTTDGYNALKEWPNHISPASAGIVYNSPTVVNNSQSGVKYTRSSAHTKWILEVEYPPMSAEDFQKFHAVAQAAHGQSTPFLFKLRNKDDVSILWADMMDTNSSLSGSVITPSAIGDAVLFLEGLTASDPEAFRQGEVFLSSENENGKLHTSIGAAASNAFGEAKVRMPWPLRAPVAQSELVNKNPANCVVTLNSDQFEYSVDVNNYYTVSVAFDLDNWK